MTITVMNRSDGPRNGLYRKLIAEFASLPHLYMQKTAYPTHERIECTNIGKKTWTRTERLNVCESVGAAVAQFLVEEEEERLLAELIAGQFAYEDNDASHVLAYCRQVLQGHPPAVAAKPPKRERPWLGETDDAAQARELSHRERLIAKEAKDFLKAHDFLNVDGLLKFRLRGYKEELKETVEYAAAEYAMDKQYQEFISLLQYFVFIQDTKVPAVHLIHKGGHEFDLLDETMAPIDTSSLDTTMTVEVLDKDFNFEDMIVSTLITVAPQHIHVHTREPEVQLIRTIMQIFEGRARLCTFCRQCKPALGDGVVLEADTGTIGNGL
ncbi:putative sporulation protein YtxC [Paenibacillus cymbidii]|uniref:putative sporulation protein YtxC n=1 Tax=Paenibacillus cymbidii TaxID=1639034 RepID=UPI00108139EE|nr:putative sporulation protein YtxC [Paenibacillus cymbidii]